MVMGPHPTAGFCLIILFAGQAVELEEVKKNEAEAQQAK